MVTITEARTLHLNLNGLGVVDVIALRIEGSQTSALGRKRTFAGTESSLRST